MQIIDISSSDEEDFHFDFVRPRSPRRAAVKGKGKAKTKPRARTPEVVWMSDSDGAGAAVRNVGLEPIPTASSSGASGPIETADIDPLAQVLEVVPDVDPAYAQELIARNLPTFGPNVVETVLQTLLEDSSYPKLSKKRKLEAPAGGSTHKKAKTSEIDYGSTARKYTGGVYYAELALDQLGLDFPDIPKAFLRKTIATKDGFYAPTYLFIADQKKQNINMGYNPKKTVARAAKGKGRAREDAEFEREKAWLARHLKNAPEDDDDDVCAEGQGIECGCCFTEYAFSKMVQCPDAHLFCSECVTQYASTQLGSHDPSILCMDQSGCKHPFPESELRRLLSPKLWGLYERIKQQKEIEAAGLDGLEECPFCDYKCVMDNPNEKLFRCGNEDSCGAVTCRSCKKADHLPKSCKEMEEDKHLDGRHQIEEAMTRALMRNCPKCNKGFIKEAGCNKMSCPYCQTLSCYVCRQVIVGYDHFNQYAPGHPAYAASKKCLLWDSVEARHADEVKAAADKALAAYRAENPDVDEAEIQVDLPPAPPPPAPAPTPAYHDLLGMGVNAGWYAPYIPMPLPAAQMFVPPPQLPPARAARRRHR